MDQLAQALSKVIGAEKSPDIFGKPTWFLHSGAYALDYILSGKVDGTGGYPGGTEVEVYGPPSAGKTLLCDLAIANIQKLGGLAAILDVEKRFDMDFAKFHGVDPSRTMPVPIDTVEDFAVKTSDLLDSAIKLKKSGVEVPKLLILLDSIGALSTLKEMDDQGTKADQGRRAQRLRAAMRVLPGKIYEAQAIMMATNHTTEKVGVMFGPKETTSGGSGYRYQASSRLEMFPTRQIKVAGKERPIGVVMNILCSKSSVTVPFGRCELAMTWARGVDKYSGLFNIAKDIEVIKPEGKQFVWGDEKFWGKDFRDICIAHPEILLDKLWTEPYFKTGVEDEVNYSEESDGSDL